MNLEKYKRIADAETILGRELVTQIVTSIFTPEEYTKYTRYKKGIGYEDEFACLLTQVGTCKTVIQLNQNNISNDTSIIIADLLACFYYKVVSTKEYCFNCFIEVKSTQKDYYKIQLNDLKKRIRFANQFNFPLLFAIRFTRFNPQAVWTLIDSTELLSQKGKIYLSTISDVALNEVILQDYIIYIKPALRIMYIYDRKPKDTWWIIENIGQLKSIKIYDDNELIFNIIDRMELIQYSMFIDCFFKEIIYKKVYDDIIVLEYRNEYQSRLLSDLIYALNHLPCDPQGNPLNTEFQILIDKNYKNMTREYVELIIKRINEKRVLLFKIGLCDEKRREREKNWLKSLVNEENQNIAQQ